MKESKKIESHIVFICLGIIIIALIVALIVLVFSYNHLENKYDNLEDMYNYQINHNENLNSEYINRDRAIAIALDDLNLKRNDVYDLDIELEYKSRYEKAVYEISFNNNHYEYEYFIDATSGKILDYYKSWD